MVTLRPYQEEAVKAIEDEWSNGRTKTLLVLPTGTGKTVVFSEVAKDMVEAGDRVLILAHRGELLDQAADKLRNSTGLVASVEKAEQTAVDSFNRVVVGSVQTMQRENRLEQYKEDEFQTIIIDEAHHSIAEGYQTVLKRFPSAKVLGVTATPDRSDMRNLGKYYESLAYEYSLPRAIREGYLCKIKALTIPLNIDISQLTVANGDFKASEISNALEPYLEQIADELSVLCVHRKTVVFLPLIKTSQHFRDLLIERGMTAAEVNGESEDRKQIIKDFEDGKYQVLCNSILLAEGWDCPSVDCIVCLRPTKSRSLYCQMVGRGTRLNDGKDHLLLLDFLWLTAKHELCRPASLICKHDDTAKVMTRNLEKEKEAVDILDAEEQAEKDVIHEREEALAKQLEQMKKRKRQYVDPLQYEMSIQAEDLYSYVPSFAWEMEVPSEKQKKALEKAGIFPDEIESKGKAQILLDRLDKRRKQGLSTPKQIRCLERYGFIHVGEWTFTEAQYMVKRLALNKWRVPNDINPKTYRIERTFEYEI